MWDKESGKPKGQHEELRMARILNLEKRKGNRITWCYFLSLSKSTDKQKGMAFGKQERPVD